MSETRRLLNLYLLPYVDISARVKDLLSTVHSASCVAEYKAIQMYNSLGIIEESCIREAFADLTLSSSGYSLICFFSVPCVDQEMALHYAKERIKKGFLKKEYYRENRYIE